MVGLVASLALLLGAVVGLWIGARAFVDSAVSLTRGRTGVSVGNLLGSNVFNALGVLGVAGLIRPLAVDPAALADIGWLIAVTGFVTVSLWSGHRLSRVEDGLLMGPEVLRWGLDFLR